MLPQVSLTSVVLVSLSMTVGCAPRGPATDPGVSCEEQRTHLLEVVAKLPKEAHGSELELLLPTSAFNGAFIAGPTLEIDEPRLSFQGQDLPGQSREARIAALEQQLAKQSFQGPLLIAAASQTDVRTLHDYLEVVPKNVNPRLLFKTPALPEDPSALSSELDLADQVLLERDPIKRKALAAQGYSRFARCSATQAVAESVENLSPNQRWPAIAKEMPHAIAACPCEQLQPDPLRRLLVAEQRAGTAAIGSVSAAFLSDLRCRASMPLRSVQQVLEDIDEFDAEFSGDWREDALVFDQVVTNERLLVYLCNAMAGDVLAEMQRERRSVHFRPHGSERCQEWRFAPIAKGAPMGSLERVNEPRADSPVVFHYRQAANDLRLFGPAPAGSLATDSASWPCDQELHMASAELDHISLTDNGSWFFSAEACEKAPSQALFRTCLNAPAVAEHKPATQSPDQN